MSATELPTCRIRLANLSRASTSASSSSKAMPVSKLMRCVRAASSTAAGKPPHRNAETTVLVSATTRTFGPCGGDLGVDLVFGQLRLEGSQLAHRGEELIDLASPHRLAQQRLDGLVTQEARGLGLFCKVVGKADGDGRHNRISRSWRPACCNTPSSSCITMGCRVPDGW